MNIIFLDHISRPVIQNNDGHPKDTAQQSKVLIPLKPKDPMEDYMRQRKERRQENTKRLRSMKKRFPSVRKHWMPAKNS